MGLLMHGAGDLETKDTGKAEVLDVLFVLFFTDTLSNGMSMWKSLAQGRLALKEGGSCQGTFITGQT